MSQRRIVIVNDASMARGGATVLALMAAKAMAKRGHEVIWLTGDSGDNPDLAAHGIEVIALGAKALLELSRGRAVFAGIRNAPAAEMVRTFIAERDTPETVYHVHSWAQIFSPALFTALAPVAGRTLIHAHDMFLACPNGVFMDYRRDEVCTRVPLSLACIGTNCDKRSYVQKLWRVARQRVLWQALGDVDAWGGILVIHPAMKPRLARAGFAQSNMYPVRNPVLPYSSTRIAAENNTELVYVGRLEADKGVGELAAAAARTGVALTMVGDGALRAEIETRYPQVHVTGWVESHEIGAYAARARALVMPSRHPEPFALVIAEAVASGLPVLVAETALMSGEVEAGGVGFAFDTFGRESIDATLRRMMALPAEDLRRMSERGFSGEVALGNTPEGWIDALEVEYERVISPRTAHDIRRANAAPAV